MAADGLVVGVDVATGAVRAVAADASGHRHAAAEADLPPPVSPRPGESEQDPGSWWPAAAAALSALTAGLAGARGSVVAVSVAAASGTVAALGPDGSPVHPALTYADQRAVDEAARAQEAGAGRWARLGLRVGPSFGLPKWAWLVRTAPAGAVARLVHASDVVVSGLLGGTAVTDWSHALKSGYDPDRGEWATEAFDALGIPGRLLPDVAPPGTAVGTVTEQAARATGLPRGCEVRLGMTDGCAAQLAAGAGGPGARVAVLGTTLVLKGVSPTLVTDPLGAVYSHRHPQGWWLPGGASSTGGGAVRRAFPDGDLGALDRRAERLGPASAVVYPLPGRGERFPVAAPAADGFTLGARGDDLHWYRALLEGVAFVERLGWERLAALGVPVTEPVRTVGGGATSAVWSRIRATVLGGPVVAVPEASTALGACMLAAGGTLHPDTATATRAMVPGGTAADPVGAERNALEERYGRFLAEVTERGWLGG